MMKRAIQITCWAILLSSIGASGAAAQNSSLLYAHATAQASPANTGSTAGSGPQAVPNPTQIPLRSVGQYGRDDLDQGGFVGAGAGGNDRAPVQLSGASWTFQPPPPLRVFQINDVVTIRVDEITRVMAQGNAVSRKRTLYEAILTDWIRLQDFRLRPDPQENGDPTIAAESNKNFRAQSRLETRESLAFNIAATVVDIRPNGNLVLEASKTIRVNDNLWETALTGICRATDIGPDNVVLSKDLIDLEIRKGDQGHLRDSYKRGWLQRILDRLQFF